MIFYFSPFILGPAKFCQPCPALTDPSWPLPVLSGTSWPSPALPCPGWPAALIQPAWHCSVRPCPTLRDPARPWPVLKNLPGPALLYQFYYIWPTQPGSTLSCLALHCLTLPFPPCPVLLTMSGLAQPCSALTDPYWPRPVLFGPVRHFPTLPGFVLRCLARLCTSLQCPVPSFQPCPTLFGPVRTVHIIIMVVFLVCNAFCESKMYSFG